ncbi:MAG: peptidoglycan DD-metalloendopeptidase family protein [Gammaproteobacteria bacterium]
MMSRCAVLAAATLLTACGGTLAPVEDLHAPSVRALPSQAPAPLPPGYHAVRRGETLYAIAFLYGYSYQQLANWNHIAPPYAIYVGQRLRVMPPGARAPSPIRVLPAEPGPASGNATPASPAEAASPTSKPGLPERLPSGPLRWTWPTRGNLLHSFDPSQPGGKGIDIDGTAGQTVNAAADGWVVYSGSGLMGYGQLIIVKHDKSLLSAYAHNKNMLVKEGEAVRAGQPIAAMGMNSANQPTLHFEIRRDGKPVDPLLYLPAR